MEIPAVLRLLLLFFAPPSSSAASAATEAPRSHRHWYTFPTVRGRPTGNRVVPVASGSGYSSPPGGAIDVELEDGAGDALRIAGTTTAAKEVASSAEDERKRGGGDRFAVTTSAGFAYLIVPSSSSASWEAIRLERYSPASADSPPVFRAATGEGGGVDVEAVRLAADDQAALSHPVAVPLPKDDDGGGGCGGEGAGPWYAYISSSGDVVLWDDSADAELDRLEGAGALPDGRIVLSPAGEAAVGRAAPSPLLLALYGGSADSYRHCVLGDCLEGTRLLLLRIYLERSDDGASRRPRLMVQTDVALPSGVVFEGINPFFLDDGSALVTTVADQDKGARLRTYSLDGAILRESPFLGWGWRHQLFHATMGPDTSTAPCLVDVLTPHVRKSVEFFDVFPLGNANASAAGAVSAAAATMELRAQAQAGGYTTHAIGSRNLDTGLAADLDGDGLLEAVLPTGTMMELAGLQLRPARGSTVGWEGPLEVYEAWRMALPGKLSSNLAAAQSPSSEGIALAAASGRTVRIWLPPARTTEEEGGGDGSGAGGDDGGSSGGDGVAAEEKEMPSPGADAETFQGASSVRWRRRPAAGRTAALLASAVVATDAALSLLW